MLNRLVTWLAAAGPPGDRDEERRADQAHDPWRPGHAQGRSTVWPHDNKGCGALGRGALQSMAARQFKA